ncbi:MAG: 50S ribosomal protein L22 [Candidatus Wildermuthbacteria bacterium]|nr:50S ribosomal protein L22 [Candidatus Wildermuthbacteria bacterium]MBI2121377.1 50S ribosomal protein L22 [Candidatus Wildermuthbacteria bacterium]MBI2647932.1 50S ribosomal protein L22 [Candidatus Wildermuthbacteria bacterium]
MEQSARAQLRNLRIAPRKVRLVADLVRGKSVQEAERILRALPQKSALPMAKVLKSAVANAGQVVSAPPERSLYIARLLVNEGAKLKRSMPRSRGQAFRIQKKTSHIFLVLESAPLASGGRQKDDKLLMRETEGARPREEAKEAQGTRKPASAHRLLAKKEKAGKSTTVLKRIFRRKSI